MHDVFENLYINSKGYYVSSHTRRVDSEFSFIAFKLEWGIFDNQFKLILEFFSEVKDRKPPEGGDLTSRAKFTGGILSDMAFQPWSYYVVADNDFVYFGIPEKYAIEMVFISVTSKQIFLPTSFSSKMAEPMRWPQKTTISLPSVIALRLLRMAEDKKIWLICFFKHNRL